VKRSSVCLLTLLSSAQIINAASIFSNIGSPHNGYTDATWNHWVGQAFQVTSNAPASLITSVSLPLLTTGLIFHRSRSLR
jgi:hypothetical protein